MRFFVFFLLSVISFLSIPLSSLACSCMSMDQPEEILEQYDVAFLGTAQKSEKEDGVIETNFSVTMSWKGAMQNSIEVISQQPNGGANCGISFDIGDNYLIFATEEEPGIYSTNICSGSKSEANQEFVQGLGTPKFIAIGGSEIMEEEEPENSKENEELKMKNGENIEESENQEHQGNYENKGTDSEEEEINENKIPPSLPLSKGEQFTQESPLNKRDLGDSKITQQFPDIPETHENFTAILYLKENEIVGGFDDETFRPNEQISRAAFTKIIIGTQFPEEEIESCIADNTDANVDYAFFSDVPKEWWFAPYVCVAKVKGVVGGFSDGTFGPDKKIAFPASAKIIVEAFGFTTEEHETWYKPYVEKLGEMSAIPPAIQNLDYQITRADMAEMVWRLKTRELMKESKMASDILQSNCVAFQSENIPGVDMNRVREAWLSLTNGKRNELGRVPYILNSHLNRTATAWSQRMAEMGEVTHKRPGQQKYYDYQLMTAWFMGYGLEFANVNRTTHTENIGRGHLSCSEADCTQPLIQEMRSLFERYLAEEGTEDDAHFSSIVNENFRIIGVGVTQKDTEYYMVIHYGTELITTPGEVCE